MTTHWKLFVDDERVGPQSRDWTFAANYETAIKLIEKNGMPEEMSLDHDIWTGLIQGTGFTSWLVSYVKKGNALPDSFKYSIHSSNEEGAAAMIDVMTFLSNKAPTHIREWWND